MDQIQESQGVWITLLLDRLRAKESRKGIKLNITTAKLSNRTLTIDPPLELTPIFDESKKLYIIEDESLSILVFAHNLELLHSELIEELFFLWDAYALEDPELLTEKSQELQTALQKRFHE